MNKKIIFIVVLCFGLGTLNSNGTGFPGMKKNSEFILKNKETSTAAEKNKKIPFSKLRFTDVGAATKTGTKIIKKDEIKIEARGADIWGKHDEFNFGYSKLTGDFEISVQVLNLSKNNFKS